MATPKPVVALKTPAKLTSPNVKTNELLNEQFATPNADVEPQSNSPQRRYPARTRGPPIRYGDCTEIQSDDENGDLSSKCAITTIDLCYRMSIVPKSYEAAISSPEADEWRQAMDDEMTALEENNTFKLSNLPSNRKCVGGKWVYSVKPGIENQPQYKARYCAKGFTQKSGIDYEETFAPTARMTTLRTLIHVATQNDMFIEQMDVKSAFLHSSIDKEIYVRQPKGYEKYDSNGKELCFLL